MKNTQTLPPHPLLDFYPMTPQNKHLASKAFVNLLALDNSFTCYAQIDSGSEDSIITQGYLNQLDTGNLKVKPTKVKMLTFGNQVILAKGFITMSVNLYKSPHQIELEVLIDPTVKVFNAILGQTICRVLQFDVDIAVIDPMRCTFRQNCLEPSVDSITTPLFTNRLDDTSNVLKTQSLFRYSVPYLHAVISSRKVTILLDTGAVRSTVELSFIEEMEMNDEILPHVGQLHGAAGSVNIVGMITLKLYLTSKKGVTTIYPHKFWVSDGSGEDVSLGFTFLTQHNLVHSNSQNGLINSNREIIVDYFYPRDITFTSRKVLPKVRVRPPIHTAHPQQILVKSNALRLSETDTVSKHSRAQSCFSRENANSSDSSMDMDSVHNSITQESGRSSGLQKPWVER